MRWLRARERGGRNVIAECFRTMALLAGRPCRRGGAGMRMNAFCVQASDERWDDAGDFVGTQACGIRRGHGLFPAWSAVRIFVVS